MCDRAVIMNEQQFSPKSRADGFPKDLNDAIQSSSALSQTEKEELEVFLRSAPDNLKVELQELLHSAWLNPGLPISIISGQALDSTLYLTFLLDCLQELEDSGFDANILYSRLKSNLDLLDSSLVKVLRAWADDIFSEDSEEQNLRTARLIGNFSSLVDQFPLGDVGINREVAIAGYLAISKIFTLEKYPEDWALLQNNLGAAYRNRGRGNKTDNIERAIFAYQSALEVYSIDESPTEWAKTHFHLGNAFIDRVLGVKSDNIEAAINHLNQALQIRTRHRFPCQWANTQTSLGNAYFLRICGDRIQNLENAIESFYLALEVYACDSYPKDWARVQVNLGNVYTVRIQADRLENLENALKAFEAASRVFSKDEFPERWAELNSGRGYCYCLRIEGDRSQNLEKAIFSFNEASEFYAFVNFPMRWAEAMIGMGIAYADRIEGSQESNIEKAIEAYENALQILTRKNSPERWADVLNNLGLAYHKRILGDFDQNVNQAIGCYNKALQIRTLETFPEAWAQTQNNLGNAYRSIERLSEAIAAFKSALKVWTPSNSPEFSLQAAQSLGEIYFETKQFTEGMAAFEKAIQSAEQIRGWVDSPHRKQEILSDAIDVFVRMVEICIQTEQYCDALEYVERSKTRNLVELIFIRDQYSIFPNEVAKQLNQLRNEMATILSQLQTVSATESTALTQKLRQLRQLHQGLQDQYLPTNSGFQFESFRSILNDRTIVIEFYFTGDKLLVFLMGERDEQPIVLPPTLIEVEQLVRWVNDYLKTYIEDRNYWQSYLEARLDMLAKILHLDKIIEQVPSNFTNLIFVPHRFLHLLPLHALTLSKGNMLFDRFPDGISYAPSCQLFQIAQKRDRSHFANFVAIQNPTKDLIFTNLEVETIQRQFEAGQAQILKETNATKSAVSNNTLNAVHCLHFSCHGSFNLANPQESCLHLADAPLSLPDIFSLNLDQCRLVTLSACETGLTDFQNASDEYIGLPSGFLYAGSRNVVSSLWTVNDQSTALLMAKFYENLRNQDSVAVALNQAQCWLRDLTGVQLKAWIEEEAIPLSPTLKTGWLNRIPDDAQPFQDPFHWAGFCAIGD